jgi:hypothetical protein
MEAVVGKVGIEVHSDLLDLTWIFPNKDCSLISKD